MCSVNVEFVFSPNVVFLELELELEAPSLTEDRGHA